MGSPGGRRGPCPEGPFQGPEASWGMEFHTSVTEIGIRRPTVL